MSLAGLSLSPSGFSFALMEPPMITAGLTPGQPALSIILSSDVSVSLVADVGFHFDFSPKPGPLAISFNFDLSVSAQITLALTAALGYQYPGGIGRNFTDVMSTVRGGCLMPADFVCVRSG